MTNGKVESGVWTGPFIVAEPAGLSCFMAGAMVIAKESMDCTTGYSSDTLTGMQVGHESDRR